MKTEQNLAEVDLITEVPNWLTQVQKPQILLEHCFAHSLRVLDAAPTGLVSVLLTNDARMQTLNRHYRQIDSPTNVLSFAAAQFPGAPLGDIAFGFETCSAQAMKRNILLSDHLSHLFVHGILHLFEYDHDNPKSATQMEQLETKILLECGQADPWRNEALQ